MPDEENEKDDQIQDLIDMLESKKSTNDTKPTNHSDETIAGQIKAALLDAETKDVKESKTQNASVGSYIDKFIKGVENRYMKLVILGALGFFGFGANNNIDILKHNTKVSTTVSTNINSQITDLTTIVTYLNTNLESIKAQNKIFKEELAKLKDKNKEPQPIIDSISALLPKINRTDNHNVFKNQADSIRLLKQIKMQQKSVDTLHKTMQ
mgnify:CR=1 FL=1